MCFLTCGWVMCGEYLRKVGWREIIFDLLIFLLVSDAIFLVDGPHFSHISFFSLSLVFFLFLFLFFPSSFFFFLVLYRLMRRYLYVLFNMWMGHVWRIFAKSGMEGNHF